MEKTNDKRQSFFAVESSSAATAAATVVIIALSGVGMFFSVAYLLFLMVCHGGCGGGCC